MLFRKSPTKLTDEQKRLHAEKLYQSARTSFPTVPEMTAREVMERCASNEKTILVDVRTPEEQSVSMIAGAITAEVFEAHLDKYADSMVVCYCTLGGRSGQYAVDLRARGIQAYNMPGAVLSWSHAGGEFVNRDGPTKRVHTHGPDMNLLAEGYEAV